MHVIGTAGHVDHGKSALVAALTGTHPDRLKEEKEREMTIDLGFAWLTLASGEELGIIDVPGHRDFIENMLAGVGGLDSALLVIAADEGIMPQTREHLAILDLLEVKNGLVVLTKVDLIDDPAWLELVKEDIRTFLRESVFQDSPIIPVSSRTRSGIPELIEALNSLCKVLPSRPDRGKPRLPVDRVFSIAGFGTVVTGTLADGVFSIGEEVHILPSGNIGRIRGLQNHQKKEQVAYPGSRTAINISGLSPDQIKRGDVVVLPGQYQATQRVDVQFRLLPGLSGPLRHHSEVKVFLGTNETIADVRLLGTELMNSGDNGWLQLDLRQPILAVQGDRFILRRPSPGETLGGGVVVDAHPKKRHKRFDPDVIHGLMIQAMGSPDEVILKIINDLGPTIIKDLILKSNLPNADASAALLECINSGKMLRLDAGELNEDSLVISSQQFKQIEDTTLSILKEYHSKSPLKHGMPREELKTRLKLINRLYNVMLEKMELNGSIRSGQKWIALSEHVVRFSPFQQVKVDNLLARFKANPFSPPSVKDCQAEVGEEIYSLLCGSGDLVEVSPDVVFRKIDYLGMVEMIKQALQADQHITLAEARDLLKTTRKYVQALLEHLDSIGLTIREGDVRTLK